MLKHKCTGKNKTKVHSNAKGGFKLTRPSDRKILWTLHKTTQKDKTLDMDSLNNNHNLKIYIFKR